MAPLLCAAAGGAEWGEAVSLSRAVRSPRRSCPEPSSHAPCWTLSAESFSPLLGNLPPQLQKAPYCDALGEAVGLGGFVPSQVTPRHAAAQETKGLPVRKSFLCECLECDLPFSQNCPCSGLALLVG